MIVTCADIFVSSSSWLPYKSDLFTTTRTSRALVVMSHTLTLKGRSSLLCAEYFPPIDLSKGQWSIALIGLETYNSIPNVTSSNCNIHLKKQNGVERVVTIPEGTYDIDDLNSYLKQHIEGFELRANVNTLRSEIQTTVEQIDFTPENSIGVLLGFPKRILLPQEAVIYVSDNPVDIQPVSTIRVECNISTNAFLNNKLVHTVFAFYPTTGPGYKITEVPNTPIYLPVATHILDHLEVTLVDQNSELVDFRGEEIIIRLHLKQGYGAQV